MAVPFFILYIPYNIQVALNREGIGIIILIPILNTTNKKQSSTGEL
jgi:hypothetical protein